MFGLIWLYQDYKNCDATNCGVYPDREAAKNGMLEILEEKFQYVKEDLDEEGEDGWNKWVAEKYVKHEDNLVIWEYDDGDSLNKFYIDEIEVDEDENKKKLYDKICSELSKYENSDNTEEVDTGFLEEFYSLLVQVKNHMEVDYDLH